MDNRRFQYKIAIFCLPGVTGFALFYILPFFKSIWYAFVSGTNHMTFVGFDNYITVLTNQYFQLAVTNTLIFSIVGVTVLMAISILLAAGMIEIGGKRLKNLFVIPMLMPTVSVIFAWRIIFDNASYFTMMKDGASIFQILPVLALYLWKNTGLNVILLTAAFGQIPGDIIAYARLEGASRLKIYKNILMPLSSPTLFFMGVLSFVNSLKVFRESYLFFGTNYPPDAAYTVQFYMNNHFMKLNYQTLACASSLVAVVLALIIASVYRLQARISQGVEL